MGDHRLRFGERRRPRWLQVPKYCNYRALKGPMFSAKYSLAEFLISEFSQTAEVPQRTSSHLATTISRALQPRDGKIPAMSRGQKFRYFFCLPSDIDFLYIFGQCGDNRK